MPRQEPSGYCCRMPDGKQSLDVGGTTVVVSNPGKVYFPHTGHTKLDLVRYYLAVADGALRGAGGRPNVLKRFVNGAGGEPFFQKRAPDKRPAGSRPFCSASRPGAPPRRSFPATRPPWP